MELTADQTTVPSEDPKPQTLSGLARGWRKRTLASARIAARLGTRMLRKNKEDEHQAVAAALEMLQQMDQLKGLMMKVGQMVSYLDPSLPPAAREVLARLQASSTPMAYDRIAEVVRRELGGAPEELFDSFAHQPFAAASIGQVHRASLRGRDLAVKVQYPGMEAALRSDLATLGTVARLLLALTPTDGASIVAELRERVIEECDYRQEAANQRLFHGLLDPRRAVVPEVLESHSGQRVISSAFVRGISFQQYCSDASQSEKDRAGVTIFDAVLGCIFRHCVFNADPHPGNFLFQEEKVVFLDFGCVKRFPPEFVDAWKRLARTVVEGDRGHFPAALNEIGMVAKPKQFDYDYHYEAMRHMLRPFCDDVPFTFTEEHVSRSRALLTVNNPNMRNTRMPRHFLLATRLQFGLMALLAQLGATGRWAPRFRRMLDAPTRKIW